ncbi:hypothetical protein CHLRE_01g051400v5 [Chlamydomonas reinhardtii]|uniref:ER lumen protein-retaining receptor n=2 Tax=Chlamydomonas reinhardtii TaxID=3055 RepID=A8HNG4_CHLRE|nr:uncharacterized protein CHLRE_01g051400v5 [Chlamydomonas reinhardtii]PNW88939.1 hypothetical protein CHLRE_01g051400v5 [Chlamydomonas reinhardtii]|eukprot:XP_001689774.1 KDEL receptor A [Chlamydomonas reinhardtii]
MMNIFRLAGDMTHLLSIIVLLLKMNATRSCRGVSLKTQELYAVVFVCRYLDLFTNFISLYNTVMKLIFLASTFTIIYWMRFHKVIRVTYDREQDTFRYQFLVLPCLVLAMVLNSEFTVMEVLWTFSIYLEAVAILPQLVLLQRTNNIDNLTGNYVFLLGSYRALYILNWIYRFMTEPNYRQYLVWISGIVQTIVYIDFFYYYIKSWRNNEKLSLPA